MQVKINNTPVKLDKVLYVPNLVGNLFRLTRALEKGLCVTGDNTGIKIMK